MYRMSLPPSFFFAYSCFHIYLQEISNESPITLYTGPSPSPYLIENTNMNEIRFFRDGLNESEVYTIKVSNMDSEDGREMRFGETLLYGREARIVGGSYGGVSSGVVSLE